jgi:hypothetical protein
MKQFTKAMLLAIGLGATLLGCKPDEVGPDRNQGKGRSIAGAVAEEHPNLDTICKFSDSVYFRGTDGSYYVNVCNDGDFFAPQIVPCVGDQPRWGSFVMYNGYEYRYDSLTGTVDSIHQLDVDFTLAPGIFCDFTNWLFTVNNTILLDPNTNAPIVGTDWSSLLIDPLRNEWKVRIPVSELPSPCFDMACKMHAVQLSLFEGPIQGSQVDLWAINQHWDETGHPAASNNEFAIRYCPLACLENTGGGCPNPQISTECEVVYTGITCQGSTLNRTTLTASDAGTSGNATYSWSSGQQTQSITVTPSTTTSYTVTVTSDGCAIRIVTFQVNVIDLACTISTNGGGGNGGGSHQPGCNHNHSNNSNCNGGNHNHGCNTQHSGGNSNCNHRGHGRYCSTTHATNRSCNGGHTRGCDGNHSANQTCQTRGGHRYNCNAQHNSGNCNSTLSHAQGCSQNHGQYRGCNVGSGNGNGGNCGNGGNGGNGPSTTPGVTVCHVPPGNPSGASTTCVTLSQLSQHISGICDNNGGGGNGNGGCNSGGGYGNGGYGNGGGSGQWGNGGSCSHNGGQSGCGSGNGPSHSGDYIGACNSNPCN